jgi:hypothetical protein
MNPDSKVMLEIVHEVQVVGPGQIGVHATLEQEACAADGLRLLGLLLQLLSGEDVAPAVARLVVESAEGAVDVADIRVVDVAVDDVADAAGVVVAIPCGRGGHGQVRQLGLLQQQGRLKSGDPSALEDTIQDVLRRDEGPQHV